MPSEEIELIQRLFIKGLEIPREQLIDWLIRNCQNESIRKEVISLIESRPLDDDPLEELALDLQENSPRMPAVVRMPAIPGFRIVEQIGSGGQAVVYLGIQESTGQKVAIKSLANRPDSDSQDTERFDREVQILAGLKHALIVGIIDRIDHDGRHFLITEYVEGVRLDQFFQKHRHNLKNSTSGGIVLEVYLKIIEAIAFAHSKGIIHRDLKPANILVDQFDQPKILDFGLAKSRGFNSALENRFDTQSGLVFGSLPWLSPEQVRGESIDERSDVYALGIILYQLLTDGAFPYSIDGPSFEVLKRIADDDAIPPSKRLEKQSASEKWITFVKKVEPVVLKSIAKSSRQRYQTAIELHAELNKVVYHSTVNSNVGSRTRFRNWTAVLSTMTLLILTIWIVATQTSLFRAINSTKSTEDALYADKDTATNKRVTESTWEMMAIGDGESDSWIIENNERTFELEESEFALRARIREVKPGWFQLLFRPTHDQLAVVSLTYNSFDGTLDLETPARFAANERCHVNLNADKEFDFAIAFLRDGISLFCNGKARVKIHCRNTGQWRPSLASESGEFVLQKMESNKHVPVSDFEAILSSEHENKVRELILGDRDSSIASSLLDHESNQHSVTQVYFGNKRQESEEIFTSLPFCENLYWLTLWGFNFDEDALKKISTRLKIEGLYLQGGMIDSSWPEHLSKLTKLRELEISSAVSHVDFNSLERLQNLTKLWLVNYQIRDEDLIPIGTLTGINDLRFNGELVSTDGIQHLANSPSLQRLEITNLCSTGAVLPSFLKIRPLTWLELRNCDLSDSDVDMLSKFGKLRHLNVKGCKNLSESGIERLKSFLKDCKIDSDFVKN